MSKQDTVIDSFARKSLYSKAIEADKSGADLSVSSDELMCSLGNYRTEARLRNGPNFSVYL